MCLPAESRRLRSSTGARAVRLVRPAGTTCSGIVRWTGYRPFAIYISHMAYLGPLRLGFAYGIPALFCLGAGRLTAQTSDSTSTLPADSLQLPKPFEALSRTLLIGRDSLVKLTRSQVGLRYRLGAQRPGKAFDCSALVQWVASLFGHELPRTAAQQAKTGIEVPRDTTQLLPGDLLFFGRGRRVTH